MLVSLVLVVGLYKGKVVLLEVDIYLLLMYFFCLKWEVFESKDYGKRYLLVVFYRL